MVKNASATTAVNSCTRRILTYAETMDAFSEVLARHPQLRLPVVDDSKYYFDADEAIDACDFFENELIHVEGPSKGQNLVLELWQQFVVSMIYGWKEKTFSADGEWIRTNEQIEKDIRKFREVFIFIPRKNGKSYMAAGFALKGLCADNEPGAKVVSAAADRAQAAVVYNVAKEIVELNPNFSHVVPFKNTMAIAEEYANYQTVSAEVKTKHGKNLSCIIVDEVHALDNGELIDVLFTAVGVRLQPLKIMLTTAGYDRGSVCYEYYEYAKKVQAGIVIDEQFLPIIFEAEDTDDWKDEKTWLKANPNLGISITWDYFRSEFKKALERPSHENTFKRLHLNMWTEQDVRWLPVEFWDECAQSISDQLIRGKDAWGGLDLSSKVDITAFVYFVPIDEVLNIRAMFWIPSDNIRQKIKEDRVDYDVWIRQGFVQSTQGKVVDYDAIRAYVRDTNKIVKLREVGCDPWNAQDILPKMQDHDGINVTVVDQTIGNLSNPTKELEAKIISKRIAHGGNPVLRWMFSNIAVWKDSNGNVRFSKKLCRNKIDGMAALVNGLNRFLASKEEPPSIYKKRGIKVIG